MNSEAGYERIESNTNDANCLEFTLTPQNIQDGILLHPNADFKVEWNHQRNEVPYFLEFHGVPLELWQKWLDRVNDLWIERTENLASATLTSWSICTWILIPVFGGLFYWLTTSVPGNKTSWKATWQLVSYYCFVLSPLLCLTCCFLDGVRISHICLSEICEAEEEIEKAWSDFVSSLNTEKCKQLGLHVVVVRYHLEFINSENRFYVPIGLQFSASSEGEAAFMTCEIFQCKEVSIISSNSHSTLTRPENFSFTLLPHNITNHTLFKTGRNFKVEYMYKRHEVPCFLQYHGVTLNVWQSWFDTMHDKWSKRVVNFAPQGSFMHTFFFFLILWSFYILMILLEAPGFDTETEGTFSILKCFMILFSASVWCFAGAEVFIIAMTPSFETKEKAIEREWSKFISEIRARDSKKFKLTVEAIRYNMLFQGNKDEVTILDMTVGLRFSEISDREL